MNLKPLYLMPWDMLPKGQFHWGRRETYRKDKQWFFWLGLPIFSDRYDVCSNEVRPSQLCLLWQSGIGFRIVPRFKYETIV